jgi:hypothetical protein
MLRHTKRQLYENIWNRKRLPSVLTLLIRQILPFWLFPISEAQKNTLLKENIKPENSPFGYFPVSEQYTYENAIKNWIKRLKLCKSHGGEYFKGLSKLLLHCLLSTSENWPSCIHIWTPLVCLINRLHQTKCEIISWYCCFNCLFKVYLVNLRQVQDCDCDKWYQMLTSQSRNSAL